MQAEPPLASPAPPKSRFRPIVQFEVGPGPQDRRNNLRVLQSDVLLKPARVAELHGGWGREGLESPSCYFLYSEGGARISIMTGPGNSSPHP
jgi:hypothetical protein